MFSGEQAHQLDAKNRIRIPAKFKSEITEKMVFCKGTTPCIFVLPKSEFEKMAEKFSSVSLFDAEMQESLSFFMSSFEEVDEDNQGRILIPPALREYAGIDKNVITVGVFNRLEIWSEEFRKEAAKRKSYAERMKDLHERTM